MPYEVPASKASFKQNRFEFTIWDYDDGERIPGSDVTYSIPKMQYINSDIRQRMLEVSMPLKKIIDEGGKPAPEQAAEVTKIQRELFEKYAPGLYGRIADDQLNAIQEAWQEASGIQLGESSASAD